MSILLDQVVRPTTTDIDISSPDVKVARVIDVILDDSHPDFDFFGKSECIGMIKYRVLGGKSTIEKDEYDQYSGIAYPSNRNFNLFPLKNEVVYIEKGPSNSGEDISSNLRSYYTTVYSVYNHIHHNALPVDTKKAKVDIGEGIDEQETIAPLQPLPGDLILQGRLGQSFRFSGGLSEKSPWTDNSNKNSPITIIRNGQKEVEDGFHNIFEDVNEDHTSIFLTSNHTIPLTLANEKRESYDSEPETPSSYQGAQLVLNSNKVTINAKQDSLLLSSLSSIGLNSSTVNIDGDEYMCLDADKIYLGVAARTNRGANKQPAVLGHRMEAFMQDVLDQLISIAKAMGKAKTIKGDAIPTINLRGNSSRRVLRQLKRQLNPKGNSNLKSKKLYIE